MAQSDLFIMWGIVSTSLNHVSGGGPIRSTASVSAGLSHSRSLSRSRFLAKQGY
jgi:hypothetical protein